MLVSFITIFKLFDKPLKEIKVYSDIEFYIDEDSLTSSSAKITMIVNSNQKYITSNWYRIDENIDGKWFKMKIAEEMVSTMEAYIIDKNESFISNINWEKYYGKLSKGKYRIIKSVYPENNKPKNDDEKHYAVAEFIIN